MKTKTRFPAAMLSRRREELARFLEQNGVETITSWPKPMWRHEGLNLGTPRFPETEAICREVLSLSMNAEMSDESADYVIEKVRACFGR